MINAILNYTYMQNALIAAILASLIYGIIGTIIVEKKLGSMSGGIAHASFAGIGAGYFFNIEPILGGLIAALIAGLGVGYFKRKTKLYEGAIINMFWAAGMAIGIMFISLTPGYQPDMASYLFGNILSVNKTYITIMSILLVVVIFAIISLYNYWKLYLFDEEYAKIKGVNVVYLEMLLYALIAFSVVVLIKVVGIILAIAMMTIPPAISKLFTNKLKNVMILSSIFGVLFSLVGLVTSYYLDIPSGSTIILIAIFTYFLVSIFKNIKNS